MKKPNFFKTLWSYIKNTLAVPFVVWRKNYKLWEKIYTVIMFILFWWIIAPVLAIIEHKIDLKIYKQWPKEEAQRA